MYVMKLLEYTHDQCHLVLFLAVLVLLELTDQGRSMSSVARSSQVSLLLVELLLRFEYLKTPITLVSL